LLLILIFLIKNKVGVYKVFTFLLFGVWEGLNQYNQNIFIFIKNPININLINGVMLIHPNVLYTLYAFIIAAALFLFVNSKQKTTKNINKFYLNKQHVNFTIMALFLGSYWAEQELF
jgi:hypothetical protein